MCKSEIRGLIPFLDLLLDEHKTFRRRVFSSIVLSWIHFIWQVSMSWVQPKAPEQITSRLDFSAFYAYFTDLPIADFKNIYYRSRAYQDFSSKGQKSSECRATQSGSQVYGSGFEKMKKIQTFVLSDLVLKMKLVVCFSLMLKLFAILCVCDTWEFTWFILWWFTIAVRWVMLCELRHCKNICMFLACNKF